MATMRELAKKLCKEYKDDNLMITSDIKPNYTRMSTGALGLDYVLAGGIPLGRILEFSGLQHSGKTTAACVVLAAYQRKFPDKQSVYIDVEHSLDLRFQAKMTGLDLQNLWYVSPNGQSGQEILDMIVEMQKTDDIGMIVLDSLPALIPATVLENDFTKDAGMRATMAKPLYPFCASMASSVAAKDNLFLMINQVRDDGKTFTGVQKYKEPCGAAPGYYSSIIVRFGTRKFTLGDDMDACGAKNGEGADGFRLHFKIMKNKCGACNRGGGFLTFRYETGFDWINDLLEIALSFGFIKRLNNITYQLINLETGEVYVDEDGNALQGKKADLIAYIKGNLDFQNKYLAMLNKVISNEDANYGNILDERINAELDAQQNAIDNQFVVDKSVDN